ncbi:MAG: phenylalanine--tRNA ligase subunit beta [Candidatus Altimarinota bacterium]
MRIPLSWVSLYTPISHLLKSSNIRDLAHIYSTHTAEIDGIEEYLIDKVVVGKVISCEKHPDSKKLSIVRVNQGEFGEETILTGAPNISEAKYVAVALVGARLPGDFLISERPMAGMMSRGMICGADEIGLSKESDGGIMILEQLWEEDTLEKMLGKSLFDLSLPFPGNNGKVFEYSIGEAMFEIDNKFITNRPDLFSVLGNAREFHAIFDTPTFLTHTYSYSNEKTVQNLKKLDTKIETRACLSYHLLEMKDIVVGKSPFGIKLMMERADLTVKMDIVDITNLIMTELGQPMHVFDSDKLVGGITVRQAKEGESLLALNGVTYKLSPLDMVIADERGPVALAGVIGGMETAVSEETRNILWESACFDATSVRLTAQRHGIRTDASTRYEKSLDPILASTPFPRVIEYLEFLGKNIHLTGASEYIDASQIREIELDVTEEFIDMKAGVHIPKNEITAILNRLGFTLSGVFENTIHIKVPSWRSSKDINIKEDIAEEIARIYGYDKTPLASLGGGFSIGKKNLDAKLRNMILSYLSQKNWNEVYTYSFTNEKLERAIKKENLDDAITVINAFNEEYTHMRTSLAPRLLLAASENIKQSKSFGFFEIGKVYSKNGVNASPLLEEIEKKPFSEKKKIAGILIGGSLEKLRSDIEGLLNQSLSYIPPVHTGTRLSFLHPGASGTYNEGETVIAEFGNIHPAVSSAFGLGDCLYFEIDFEILLSHMKESEVRFEPISRYQTIARELNFLMDEHTPTGDVARILDALHPWITQVTVDSIFTDKEKIGEGKKSVNYAFILSNHDATISDEEALSVQNHIIEEMKHRGFELRR